MIAETASNRSEFRIADKVARNLLRQGMPIELVAQVTELTIDQVRELRDRL